MEQIVHSINGRNYVHFTLSVPYSQLQTVNKRLKQLEGFSNGAIIAPNSGGLLEMLFGGLKLVNVSMLVPEENAIAFATKID